MRDELKAAFRSLRSSKGPTLAALIVLTLGIGATTAIFSVVDAVVLRGLPFDEHDRLVAVGERSVGSGQSGRLDGDPQAVSLVAPQNYTDWAAQQRVFRIDRRDRQRLAHAARARVRARVAGAPACHGGLFPRAARSAGDRQSLRD